MINKHEIKKVLRNEIVTCKGISMVKVEEFIKLAKKICKKKFSVNLNYSMESISGVNNVLQKKLNDYLMFAEINTLLIGLGFYVGEVIIRNFGGSWGTDFVLPNRSNKEVLSPLVLKKGDLWWSPTDKLISLIEGKSSQSLADYVNKIGSEISKNKKFVSEEDESIYRLLTDGFRTGIGWSFRKPKELIKKAERFVFQKFSKKLSYSLDSAEELGKIINKLKTLNLSPDKLAELIVGLGYYLGEMLSKQYGENWMKNEYLYWFNRNIPLSSLGKLEIFRNPVNAAISAYKNGGWILDNYIKEVKQVAERNKKIKPIKISNLTINESDKMLDFLIKNSVRKFTFSIINIYNTPAINKLSDDLVKALEKNRTGFYHFFNQETKEILKRFLAKGILPNYFKMENNFEDFIFFTDERVFLETITHENEGFLYLTEKELKEFEQLGIKHEIFVERKKRYLEKNLSIKIFRK